MIENLRQNVRVSVALATYNGSAYINLLLDSLFKQSIKVYEIVIIDDCSTDNTVEIIKSYQRLHPEIKYIVNEKNLGAIASFRKAVENCSGDYFALCDQDDVWLENKIEISLLNLQDIESLNKPSLVYSDLSLIDSAGNLKSASFWKSQNIHPERETFSTLLYGNILTGCTVLFGKEMKVEMLKMPDSILMHDHWLALIAFSIGSVRAINQPTLFYRDHSQSVTQKGNISIFNRIIHNLKSIVNGDNYLSKNISQAQAFEEMYSKRLSEDQRIKLNQFLKLEGKNLFVKKWSSFRRYFRG